MKSINMTRVLTWVVAALVMCVTTGSGKDIANPESGRVKECRAKAPGKFVRLDKDLTIHYQTAGHGDINIIFIPGWMHSSEVFVRQLEHFKGSNDFTAIAYDPRGHGFSSHPVEGHTYQQHARDLAAFIKALNLDKIILAGWSYGVTEQLSYINQFGTANLLGMVMIDTGPDIAGESYNEWVWYLRDDSDEYSRYFTEGIIEYRDSIIEGFAAYMLEDVSSENVAWVKKITSRCSSTVASVLNATAFYLDYSADLIALEGKMPLLYVVSEWWEYAAEPWISANTPSAQRTYLGKHMMFWERADEFNIVLDTYLSQFLP
ncbi:MAG: alpha/beta hydrolase [Lentisphaeria bacterium]|nr:alpha/beta hydrolase [Lentisphaeria bacterium]